MMKHFSKLLMAATLLLGLGNSMYGTDFSLIYLLLMTCAVKVASATQFSPMKA